MPPDHTTLSLMKTRRTPKLKGVVAPGPTGAQLDELLTIAARVPDHGKLVPWRFVVIHGGAGGPGAKLGEVAAAALVARQPGVDGAKVEEVRTRFGAVPLTVAVVSCVKGDPTEPSRPHPSVPVLDQELSAGAVCMNYIIAAKAMGFGVVWLTEWLARDAAVLAAIGVKGTERVAGFLYTGTAPEGREDRPRPVMGEIVTVL
jgi:nitroreductase